MESRDSNCLALKEASYFKRKKGVKRVFGDGAYDSMVSLEKLRLMEQSQ